MDKSNILLIVVILCWTINPFLKKHIGKKMNPEENMMINHIVISIFLWIYFIYLIRNGNISNNCIRKLDKKDITCLLGSSISTIIASFLLTYLLTNHDASDIIPNLQPIVILCTIFVGYFVFNETINVYKICGTLTIVFGLFIFNKGKKSIN